VIRFFHRYWDKKNQEDAAPNDSGEVNVDAWFSQYLPVDTGSCGNAVGAAAVWSLIGNNAIGHCGKNRRGEESPDECFSMGEYTREAHLK
jgi:hypothetical protein